MKALCLFVVSLFAAPLAAHAQEIDHVRPLDPWAGEALRLGLERSPTVRELVAQLQASDVIVYLETRSVLPYGAVGTTRLAAATAAYRYVRIVLFRDPMPVCRVAVLGHELQHAVEVAQSQVRDSQGMRALFNAIGRPSSGDATAYETSAAIKVSMTVWYEVHGDEKRAARIRSAALQ